MPAPDAGPKTITVTGKVVDARGTPVANSAVLVLGKQTVATDTAGTFSVPGVTVPYDIAVVTGSKQAAIVFQGVTRSDPTLPTLSYPSASTTLSATVTGSVTGAVKPSATVANPQLVFVSPESSFTATYNTAASTYSAKAYWSGSATTTGTVFAFQGERVSETAKTYTKFTGFGRRDNVVLSSDATVSNQNVALNPVANSTLAGTVTFPKDYTLSSHEVSLEPGASGQVELFSDPSPTTSFSYAVPVVAQSTLVFESSASTVGGKSRTYGVKTGVAAGTNNLSLALRAPSTLILPLDNATQVTRSTEFSWSELSGGVHAITLGNASTGGMPSYSLTLFTLASRTTLPDLSALGIALPASTSLRWQINDIHPVASIDAFLTGVSTSGVPGGLSDYTIATSEERTLTVSSAP